MTNDVTPRILGQYFGISGNKLRTLQKLLSKSGNVKKNPITVIVLFDYGTVLKQIAPKKEITYNLIIENIDQ
ncbi:hypothetical protein [uncultured Methanomethylovorans sp.]|uniref:hypothetical protein n=1 Tax=uncultured Methanomethylovorans sp. TaxID=183759 RepID=UPI002AA69399|nr:hypothetical protein [uncultured Methanomethylovorans sp.]